MKGLLLFGLLFIFTTATLTRKGTSEGVFQDLRTGFFDRTTGRSYWVSHGYPSTLYEVNVDNFRRIRELNLQQNLATSVIYSEQTNHAYIGFNTITGGLIMKIDVNHFIIEKVVKTFHNPKSLVLDSTLNILYAATWPVKGIGSVVHKINATSLQVTDTLELSPNDGRIQTLQLDTSRHYLYAGTDNSPATILRLWAEPALRRMDVLAFPVGWNEVSTSTIDPNNQFAYFGILSPVGRLVKVDLANFKWVDTITTGTKGPSAVFLDTQRGYSYWASNEVPAVIHRVRMCDFQLLDVASFFSKDRLPRGIAMDVWRGILLFGTSCQGEEPCREPCNYVISFQVTGKGTCENSRVFVDEDNTNTYSTVVNIRLGGMFPRGASCCPSENAFFPGQATTWKPQVSTLPTNTFSSNHVGENQILKN